MAAWTEPDWWTRVRARQSATAGPDLAHRRGRVHEHAVGVSTKRHAPTCSQTIPGTAGRALSGSKVIQG